MSGGIALFIVCVLGGKRLMCCIGTELVSSVIAIFIVCVMCVSTY